MIKVLESGAWFFTESIRKAEGQEFFRFFYTWDDYGVLQLEEEKFLVGSLMELVERVERCDKRSVFLTKSLAVVATGPDAPVVTMMDTDWCLIGDRRVHGYRAISASGRCLNTRYYPDTWERRVVLPLFAWDEDVPDEYGFLDWGNSTFLYADFAAIWKQSPQRVKDIARSFTKRQQYSFSAGEFFKAERETRVSRPVEYF